MRLKDALTRGAARLATANVPSSRLNAETLLMFALAVDRAYLYAHPERELTQDEVARLDEALVQRGGGVPAQYITGHQEFWGLDLIVTSAVLIPRPETEHVVETVLRHAAAADLRAPSILDVGTGSGCIALALAGELRHARVHACDLSPEALEIARANAARLQLDERIEFRSSDLLSAYSAAEPFDFIVCNPPYVAERDAHTVEAQVRRFEPHMAVFAGETGLEIYRRLIPQASARLRHGGWLVMEIGHGMEPDVRALLGTWQNISTTLDLQSIPRVVAAQGNESC
ncbi:MAG: peptide chain release factor N(5)-glutamine methyltransferase [Acidobacteria bacterium]|nr:peptide chain release factor N(5)-glutamine methyltransferase [Acidobacteriota bacterium]